MKALFNLSHLSAGLVAVVVGYASSAILIFQAAIIAGATPAQTGSWLWALGVGMGVSSIALSLYYRVPVLMAWSTPGAALLITALAGLSLGEAIGAFLCCSLMILICGVSGLFSKLMHLVPASLASAMLAGVLLPFGLELFRAFDQHPLLIAGMLICFLVLNQWVRRYAIALTLILGLVIAGAGDMLPWHQIQLEVAQPNWVTPTFSLSSLIGVAVPLFVVTMASQNIPGIAVLRAHGYQPPVSPLISWSGGLGVLLSPFGGFAFNLAAITAAICMGEEADRNPGKRYLATTWAGIFYLVAGIFGATIVSLFTAFPGALVTAIAGLALLGTIGNSLAAGLNDPDSREAAVLTFVVTASGLSWQGVGSAFWGLVIGLLVLHAPRLSQRIGRRAIP